MTPHKVLTINQTKAWAYGSNASVHKSTGIIPPLLHTMLYLFFTP